MNRYTLGIDVGANGALALLDWNGNVIDVVKTANATEHDISDSIAEWKESGAPIVAFIETVHSMPKQGVASSFKFGDGNGFLRGLLIAHKIPFYYVTPQKWQTAMQCKTGGNKNISKAAAQRLYPDRKITHADADALLIAKYGTLQNV